MPIGFGKEYEPLAPHELVNALIDPTGFPPGSPEAILGRSRPQCRSLETDCVLASAIHDHLFPRSTFGLRTNNRTVSDGIRWGEYSKLIRRIHEIPLAASAAINEIVGGVIDAANAALEPRFLDLECDETTRKVRRLGREYAGVEVVLTEALWRTFRCFYDVGDSGDASLDAWRLALGDDFEFEGNARNKAVERLRDALIPLDVQVPSRRRCLRDARTEVELT